MGLSHLQLAYSRGCPGTDSSDSEGEDGQGAQETNIAMENCHLQMIYPLKMVIVHSYLKLPTGRGVVPKGQPLRPTRVSGASNSLVPLSQCPGVSLP
jgi:hypothetical protein